MWLQFRKMHKHWTAIVVLSLFVTGCTCRGSPSVWVFGGYECEWDRPVSDHIQLSPKQKAAESLRKQTFHQYLRDAECGDAQSQEWLGDMYRAGIGVSQDKVRAYMWYGLAASNGQPNAAIRRDHLANELTPDQIALAESMRPISLEIRTEVCTSLKWIGT